MPATYTDDDLVNLQNQEILPHHMVEIWIYKLMKSYIKRNHVTISIDHSTSLDYEVIGYHYRSGTIGDWVCKSGHISLQTCGTVSSIVYQPFASNGFWSPRYVQVQCPVGATYAMSCRGDSGSPVYKVHNNSICRRAKGKPTHFYK